MKRKPSTPKAIPRSAQVINLSDHRKPKSDRSTIKVYLPKDSLPTDNFEGLTASRTVTEWRVREGDLFIIYATKDIEKGDVVCLRSETLTNGVIGILDFDECYYYMQTSAHHEGSIHRAKSQIFGRVVEVQRGGKVIQTTLNLRPLHPLARVYQFKRRA